MLKNQHRIKILKDLYKSNYTGPYLPKFQEGGPYVGIQPAPISIAESNTIPVPKAPVYIPTPLTVEEPMFNDIDSLLKAEKEQITTSIELPDYSTKKPIATKTRSGSLNLSNIKATQEFLIDKGYNVGSTGADNKLGRNTIMAIQSFLSENGYDIGQAKYANKGVDGILGSTTKRAIAEFNQNELLGGSSTYRSKYTTEEGYLGSCTEDQCAAFNNNEVVRNTKFSESDLMNIGLTGNAWEVEKNLINKGGQYLYSREKNINKSANIRPGDQVSIYTGGRSDYQERAGSLRATHIATVDSPKYTDNSGRPYVYIIHNLHKTVGTNKYKGQVYRNKLYLDDFSIDGSHLVPMSIVAPNYEKIEGKEFSRNLPDMDLQLIDTTSSGNPYKKAALEGLNNKTFRTRASHEFDLTDEEYLSLAKSAVGLMEQESGLGEHGKLPIIPDKVELGVKEAGALLVKALKEDEASLGWARIKFNTNFGDKTKELKKDYDISKSSLSVATDKGDKSAQAALLILAKYFTALKKEHSSEDALYLAIQKFNRYNLHRKYGTEGKSSFDYAETKNLSYVNKVLDYAKAYTIQDTKNNSGDYLDYVDSLNTNPDLNYNKYIADNF